MERFQSLTGQYFRNANATVLVYDITSPKSFLNIPKWLEFMKKNADDNVQLWLVGNKKDCADRKVSKELGKTFAEMHNMQFGETSALYEPASINALFLNLARKLKEDKNFTTDPAPSTADNTTNNTASNWCC